MSASLSRLRKATPDQIYQYLVAFIATLPNTKVTITWGSPHFRVGDKIFSGWGKSSLASNSESRDIYSMGAKLHPEKQRALVSADPRFRVAPYVGKHGWVDFCPGEMVNFGELEALLLESYRNVASKRDIAQLDAMLQPKQAKAPSKSSAKRSRKQLAKPTSKVARKRASPKRVKK